MNEFDDFLNFHKDDETDFYKILGCNELSNTEQILTEYRIKVKKIHPDKTLNNSQSSTEEFAKLQTAKEILTDPQKRIDYDKWRSSGIPISYTKWVSMKGVVGMAMHWKSPKQGNPEIEHPSLENINSKSFPSVEPNSVPSEDVLSKFRNYQL